jgi:hypothetical protein
MRFVSPRRSRVLRLPDFADAIVLVEEVQLGAAEHRQASGGFVTPRRDRFRIERFGERMRGVLEVAVEIGGALFPPADAPELDRERDARQSQQNVRRRENGEGQAEGW